jgi:transposase-like protein
MASREVEGEGGVKVKRVNFYNNSKNNGQMETLSKYQILQLIKFKGLSKKNLKLFSRAKFNYKKPSQKPQKG